MVSDDLHALSVHQTRVLTAVLSDLGAPLAATLSSINDDASTFSLQPTERNSLNVARLRTLVCDLADGLGVYRVDITPSDDATTADLTAHRYHARKRTNASLAGCSSMSMADVELLVARFLTERHGNTSPSWLACQLRVSWKAAERILAELDDDNLLAPGQPALPQPHSFHYAQNVTSCDLATTLPHAAVGIGGRLARHHSSHATRPAALPRGEHHW